MREIIYKFNNLGTYTTEQSTVFADETELKLIIEPHDFSLKVGEDVLRTSHCEKYVINVLKNGEAVFYDSDSKEIAHADKTDAKFDEVRFVWEQDVLNIQFGHVETVDYYPNCDGESDRWGREWICERMVTLELESHSLKIDF